jgi:uncharacterized membrane protein YedE/YeeE
MIFEPSQIFNALIGGALIGLSASMMLLLKGRVTGISGIFSGAFSFKSENYWKVFFIIGLVIGGVGLQVLRPGSFDSSLNLSSYRIIAAGFLVGLGTRLGSGCTSGHGVCGVSRLSIRSIAATACFISFGVLTVFIFGVS